MPKVMIAHASKDEHGKFQQGDAGDQTGQEVCIHTWYKRPWNVVLSPKSTSMANKIAYAMERAAKNDHIGYDQIQRNTALAEARKVGYDPGRITKDVETDCSALVSIACMYAGIPEQVLFANGNSATTRTLRKQLMSTGKFKEFIAPTFTDIPNNLKRGDILLSEGHHVAVVVSTTFNKSIHDVAMDIIQHGNWGSGEERKRNLRDAGYDPILVQNEINRIMKGEK